jgi:hypothetical protein
VRTKQTGMEYSLMPTVQCTQENGLTIPSMGTVKSSGITEPLATKANSIKGRRTVREGSTGKTAAIMKDSLSTASFKALVSTILPTLTRLTKVSLGCQIWKAAA